MAILSQDIEISPILGDKIYLNYGDNYNEHGALAYYRPDNVLLDTTVDGTVDPFTPGEYTITYRAEHEGLYNEANMIVVVNRLSVEFTMTGENPLTWNYGDPYEDPGAFLIDRSTYEKIEVDTDVSQVDVDAIGDYQVSYTYMEGSQPVTVYRDVKVRDIEAPTFTFNIETGEGYLNTIDEEDGEAWYYWDQNQAITEEDVKALVGVTDNFDTEETLKSNMVMRYFHVVYDPDIEEDIETEGDLTGFDVADGNSIMRVRYNVTDTNGNKASEIQIEFKIKLEVQPVITLAGDNPMTLEINSQYTEPGYTAVDGMGMDITSLVEVAFEENPIENVLDNLTSAFGSKLIDYSVSDSWGNTTIVQRNIIVETSEKPVITLIQPSVNIGRLSPETDEYFLKYIEIQSADDTINLLDQTVVDQSAVDYTVHGTYPVTFNVADSFGNTADEVSMDVNVINTTKPLHGLDLDLIDREIYQGEAYDKTRLLKGVTFTDYQGNAIAEADIEADFMIFDPAIVGTHSARYRAVDSSGMYSDWITAVIVVIYSGQPIINNSNPTDKVQQHDPYTVENAMLGVTGQNANGSDLTEYISADISGVDTSTLGDYTVIYTLIDPGNNISADSASRIVNVINDLKYHIIDEREVAMYEAGHTMDDAQRIEGIKVFDSRGLEYPADTVVITDATDYAVPGEYSIAYEYTSDDGKTASHTRIIIIVPVDTRDRIFINFKLPSNVYKAEIYRSEDDANYKFIHTYTDTYSLSLKKGV